jgi:predicted SAM-dependent methyltransferase
MDRENQDHKEKLVKLNVGCINYKEGYIHVDVHQHKLSKEDGSLVSLDIIADARKLPFPENSVDEVFTEEMLEHLGRKEYKDVLKEFYRVLKPGAFLDVAVPNFLGLCEEFIRYPNKRRGLMQMFYGGQDFETDFHKMGFTYTLLEEDLEGIGFKNLENLCERGLVRIKCLK